MYPTYDKPAPGFSERAQDMLDGIISSAAFDVIMTVSLFSILIGMVLALIGGGIYSLAAYLLRSKDPLKGLAEMSPQMRATLASNLLSACLPSWFTDPTKPARVRYSIDCKGQCQIDLRTAGGDPIVAPGALIALAGRIVSPQLAPNACGVFEVEDSITIRQHLGCSAPGDEELDTLCDRFDPVACEGSAMACRRAERQRSSNRTNTAIIAANTATITAINS